MEIKVMNSPEIIVNPGLEIMPPTIISIPRIVAAKATKKEGFVIAQVDNVLLYT